MRLTLKTGFDGLIFLLGMALAALGGLESRAPAAEEASGTAAPGAAEPGKPFEYMIVVTGEEILRGAYPDAHTCFITRTLHLLGGHCVGSMTVDDRPEDIKEALAYATNKVRMVLTTGGLGPTVNDVTRGALAEFSGIPLREHPDALAEMERRFNQPRGQLRANLRRQTEVPTRGTYLKNPNGTAVGLVFEMTNVVIVALPGPPRELQPMVNNELVPYLVRKFGARPPGAAITLRFVGIGQSAIDQVMREHVPLAPDVVVSSSFEDGRVDFGFALPGRRTEDRARLEQIAKALRARLGEYVYAEDGSSLEEQVVALFRARGGTLAMVEVGSGGHLAASLDDVKDIRSLLTADWVAPAEEQVRQLLNVSDRAWAGWTAGQERVKGLGAAAMKLSKSRWTVVVGEINRNPDGARYVWLGLGMPDGGWESQRVPVLGSGETAHANLTTQILDRLRRRLTTGGN